MYVWVCAFFQWFYVFGILQFMIHVVQLIYQFIYCPVMLFKFTLRIYMLFQTRKLFSTCTFIMSYREIIDAENCYNKKKRNAIMTAIFWRWSSDLLKIVCNEWKLLDFLLFFFIRVVVNKPIVFLEEQVWL